MNIYLMIASGVVAISLIASSTVIYVTRRRSRKLLERLDKMLDEAIAGSFMEKAYDESYLSAIETKMHHYLSSCKVSHREIQLERDKVKQLIADISHQTKTPIANILLYAQLLQEQKLPKACEMMTSQIATQAEKLSFLIGALINSSRLETDCISVHCSKCYMSELLSAVEAQIRKKAEKKHITIRLNCKDEMAYFDLKWTSEALYNILDNAVKYSPGNSTVEVNIRTYELFCRIDVCDQGIGIAEEELGKVFLRFYRSERNNQSEGSGIGLYLAREIIARQGGYIKVSSKVDEGSTFSIFLPIKA